MRNVLITGGSGGIGQSLVKRFAYAGDAVYFSYCSNHSRALEIEQELADCSIHSLQFDQGEPESHRNLMNELPARIDVLINNAGLGSGTVETQTTDPREQDRKLFAVNGLGPLWLTQDVLPIMKQNQSGKIIIISSVGGGITQFSGFRLADGMSKAAVSHMTRQLAADLVHTPIDVFAVCPGATDTQMFNSSTLSEMDTESRARFVEQLPKSRLIEPQEIAEICFFLAGPDSRCLHGAVIDASMGLGVNPGCLQK